MLELTNLKKFVDDDESFVATLLDRFISNSQAEMEKIKKHITQQNWPDARNAVHKFIGSSSIFGLQEMTALLKYMERNIENDNLQELPQQLSQLESIYSTALKEAKSARAEIKSENLP